MPEPPDPQAGLTQPLLDRMRAGDQEAEHQLFEKLKAELAAEVRSRPHWKSLRKRTDLGDVVSEVWKRMLAADAFATFKTEGPGSLRRLAAKYAERTLQDLNRRAHAAKREGDLTARSLDAPASRETTSPEPATPGPGPRTQVSASELFRICDETLEEPHRTVWRMHCQEFTYEEIAAQVGMTARQVKSSILQSKRKLAVALKDHRP